MTQKSLHILSNIVDSMLRLHRANMWIQTQVSQTPKSTLSHKSSLPTFFTFNLLVAGAQEPVWWPLNSGVRRKAWSSKLSLNIQINTNFSKLLEGSYDSMWKTLSTETLTQ